MKMVAITPQILRRLAIQKQGLAGRRPSPDLQGLKKIMKMIRCIQIDPIRAVERTQYLVLFSRLGVHPMDLLDRAAYQERFLFEYWAHAASYVLTEDYPIHNHMMRNLRYGNGVMGKRYKKWVEENKRFEKYILKTLREGGPKLVSEFEDLADQSWGTGGWGNSRDATMMISSLADRGKVMVANRDGLKKYWDLAERVLPDWTPVDELSSRDTTYLAAQYAIKALGAGTEKQIKFHFTRGRYPEIKQVLEDLEADGKIVRLDLVNCPQEWIQAGPWYLHVDDLSEVEALQKGKWQPRTVLLSPFDNLIADRERTELLWGFRFRVEIYVPAKKRQYGYYVMPILHGARFIGRIDPKMDRKKGILEVISVHIELDAPESKAAVSTIRRAIDELRQFLGANDIVYSRDIPGKWAGLTRS